MSMKQEPVLTSAAGDDHGPVALVPRINVQAFCVKPQTQASIEAAFADRRMARAHGSVMQGGIPAAIRLYQTQSSPNLLLLEFDTTSEELLENLTALAEVCQPDTKVVVIGHTNDVILYRELVSRGVSEYVVAPIVPLQLVEMIAGLYRSEKAKPVGKVTAFVGARGGTGSSTLAHNAAWEIARTGDVETALVDFDVAYGTAALDFNLDASGNLVEALQQPDRIDSLFLDRLMVRIGNRLSLLASPTGVERDFNIEPYAVETILTAMRTVVPRIILDVPNLWAPWSKFVLLHADQIVITAEPDLASLRNARSLVDVLKASRPNDPPPMLLLNKVGVPRRPEISSADFRKAIGVDVLENIPFDPESFGEALNNGKMVIDIAPKARASEAVRAMVRHLTGERVAKPAPQPNFLQKILELGKK